MEFKISEGLKAYPLPELGEPTPGSGIRGVRPPTVQEGQDKINDILASIERQGGKLVGILPLEVILPLPPGILGQHAKVHPFLIIEKDVDETGSPNRYTNDPDRYKDDPDGIYRIS